MTRGIPEQRETPEHRPTTKFTEVSPFFAGSDSIGSNGPSGRYANGGHAARVMFHVVT